MPGSKRTIAALVGVAGFAIALVVVVVVLFRQFLPRAQTFSLPIAPPVRPVDAPARKPSPDEMPPGLEKAALLYWQARDAVAIGCPSETSNYYAQYPPYSPDWRKLEAAVWTANAKSRELVHEATAMDMGKLPVVADFTHFYSRLRSLANESTDAALYADWQGDDVQAIELIRDSLHIADVLEMASGGDRQIRSLVAVGIRALTAYKIMCITSGITLTGNPDSAKALPVQSARSLIKQLMDEAAPNPQFPGYMHTETFDRVRAQENLTAMSLACHLFQFDKKQWPQSLDDLVPDYLPHTIPDPWSKQMEPLGYILVPGGMPDGSDRPLVYCKFWLADGLFFRRDEPQYSFYSSDGSRSAQRDMKKGGQFFDVARWQPPNRAGPTTEAVR